MAQAPTTSLVELRGSLPSSPSFLFTQRLDSITSLPVLALLLATN